LIVVLGIFSYSGYLPGPFQRTSHVATGTPGAKTSSPAPASRPESGSGGLSGAGTRAPSPTPSATPAPPASASANGKSPAKLCEAYFADPWHDMSDFAKLSKAAGGPMKVWSYCQPYLQSHEPTSTAVPPPGSGHADSGNGSGQSGDGSTTSPQQAR
jgi:hypothetical protein